MVYRDKSFRKGQGGGEEGRERGREGLKEREGPKEISGQTVHVMGCANKLYIDSDQAFS